MHAARHYYASALLEDGVNVRAVPSIWATTTRASPSDARARTAVDRALGGAVVDGPRALEVPAGGR